MGGELSRERHAEAALRETEERFRRIADSAPVPMWVTRLDRKRDFVNRAYIDFLGITYEDAVDFDWRGLIHPDDAERLLAESVAGEASLELFVLEGRFRRRDGAWRWLRSVSQPRWGPEGEHVGFIGVAHDVTEAKEAEATIRELNQTLERRVAARALELERAQEALRQAQKMEAIGQLTGGVAHDFNNLLTIIRSSADLLRRPDLSEERRTRYVEAIAETVERASKLTGQLLAFARRQALRPEVFDVPARIVSIVDMLRAVVGSRIQITTEFGCGRCFVEADAAQFETALVNMAVNARDAMDGEGTLTLGVRSAASMPPMRGDTSVAGDFVAVSITDTGSGIPPADLPHIFEPFFTTKEIGKGTGLGLSQVYGFTKQSGGDLTVESVVGRGTTFTLYLPRGYGDPARPLEWVSTQPAPDEGQGRRVLVVEDNLQVGEFSTQMLRDLGYLTIWVTSADEALRELSAGPDRFDAVFSDVVMPGMSGVDLGREIRRRYPQLPIVLTSGYSDALAQEGRHGFELLQKPYAAEELSRILRRSTRDRTA